MLVIVLDDFNQNNGATRVVPESHLEMITLFLIKHMIMS